MMFSSYLVSFCRPHHFSFRLKGLMYKARYNKLADLWDNGDENNDSTGMNWVDIDTLGERQER